MSDRTTNPTLLKLLEAGCKVEFPNGTALKGDPKTRYIHVYLNDIDEGVWSLDKVGVMKALDDIEKMYAEYRADDFSDIAKPGYGILIYTAKDCQDYDEAMRYPTRHGPVGQPQPFNIVNEDGMWLDGANSRAEIRRKYLKRLENVVSNARRR